MPTVPLTFLGLSLLGAWFTLNAHLSIRRSGSLAIPSFFAGWLTGELPFHHIGWQMAATLCFAWLGALQSWPGWLGFAITLGSWAGLLALGRASQRSGQVIEDALVQGLSKDYRGRLPEAPGEALALPYPHGRLWVPVVFYDARVRVDEHIQYAPGNRRRQLDIHRPRSPVCRAPVLLQIHGGGWAIGHKRQQALPLLTYLAARGWVCVSANYRLWPRARFPDPLVDLKLAIRWIREHIADYGGDPDFLVVTGGSAGGHLAALIALTANDPEYQPGFEGTDTSVAACVPFYGVYDLTGRHGGRKDGGFRRFIEMVLMQRPRSEDPAAYERASPVLQIRENAPPFFVINGTHDSLTLVEGARHFVSELRRISKQPVVYAELPYAQHAFEVFHSIRAAHTIRGVHRFLSYIHALHMERSAGEAVAAARGGGKVLENPA
jgi:acetyl esterase/lipase